jgi:hypothetical protein
MKKIWTEDNRRVETGGLTINEDWTGLFIRGDDCIALKSIIMKVLRNERLSIVEIEALEGYCILIEKDVCGY